MNFEKVLLDNCREIINSWKETDIYAISFLVYSNECNKFGNFENFPEFSVGYNTESFCENAPRFSEERWNYAFWLQNNVPIISAQNEKSAQQLIEWYRENGVENLGIISEDEYDEDCNYIGKGPGGYYELLMLASQTARTLQLDGTIKSKFGSIPIIVHDLDYAWYCKDATSNANPHGEADDFIAAYDQDFAQ